MSTKFQNSLIAAIIGSIITSIATFKPTPLQVYLGVLAHEKKLIKRLFDCRLTSSCEEVRIFIISAAVACYRKRKSIQLNAKDELIQAVANNFDAKIHSLHGLQQTHVLATCLAQATSFRPTEIQNEPTILKFKRQEISTVKLKKIQTHFFVGTKNLQMPPNFFKSEVKPLKLLCEQIIQSRLSSEKDFMFLKETLTNSEVPDFHGFNIRATRES